MSERTINDIINNDSEHLNQTTYEHYEQDQHKGFNFDFLKAETGDGEIEEYIQHPLNFNNSKGMARVLRGVTGMTGNNLRLAIVDIVVGTFDLMKSSKAVANGSS